MIKCDSVLSFQEPCGDLGREAIVGLILQNRTARSQAAKRTALSEVKQRLVQLRGIRAQSQPIALSQICAIQVGIGNDAIGREPLACEMKRLDDLVFHAAVGPRSFKLGFSNWINRFCMLRRSIGSVTSGFRSRRIDLRPDLVSHSSS